MTFFNKSLALSKSLSHRPSITLLFVFMLPIILYGSVSEAVADNPDTSSKVPGETQTTPSSNPAAKPPETETPAIVKLRPLRCPTPANP